jgi:imidazole glycerol-phosphate synthase subunit HisH
MGAQSVVIVDFGIGNLWSVASALRYLGCEPLISSDPHVVEKAEVMILPGDGSFRRAMDELNTRGLTPALQQSARRGNKLLGICVGLQLFADAGTEDGGSPGLGLIPGQIDLFDATQLGPLKIPQIGFNAVRCPLGSKLYAGLGESADFYFVNSYRLVDQSGPGIYALANYGEDFVAGYEHQNVFAVQFHPEKSQTNGLRLLDNFLRA